MSEQSVAGALEALSDWLRGNDLRADYITVIDHRNITGEVALDVWPCHAGTDDDVQEREVARWASALGVEVERDGEKKSDIFRDRDDYYVSLTATSEIGGYRIQVCAHIARRSEAVAS